MPATAAPLSSMMIGDIRLTYLPDGIHHVWPTAHYTGVGDEFWAAQGHVLDEHGRLVMSLGALLVETDASNVLIDLGFGPRTIDISELTAGEHEGDLVGGELISSLSSVGLSPDDIDGVLFSHLHPDHIGWLERDGEPVFANATFYVGATEWEYWQSGPEAGTVRGPSAAQTAVMSERLSMIEDLSTPVEGVTVAATPGHTPGHLSFVVSSGIARAFVLGDMIHCPVEIGEHELESVFDVDPALNHRTRARIEEQVARPDTITVGTHFPNLVFGRVLPGTAPVQDGAYYPFGSRAVKRWAPA